MKKVIKISAEWCGPCKTYAPTFMALIDEMERGGWEVVLVDVDDDDGRAIAQEYGVRGVPATIAVMEDGSHIMNSGALSESVLREMLSI